MKYNTEKKMIFGKIRCGILGCLFSLMTLNSAYAAPISIADVPLFLGGSVAPNVMFVIDDSGSMQFEVMPQESSRNDGTVYLFPPGDNIYGSSTYNKYINTFRQGNGKNLFYRSSANNRVFYNPDHTYEPWFRGDGSQWPDADPAAALRFPGRPDSGSLNLADEHEYDKWYDRNYRYAYKDGSYSDYGIFFDQDRSYWPITFYVKKDETGADYASGNYIRYQIRDNTAYIKNGNEPEQSISQFDYPDGPSRTIAEEKQNFANWFSYYRSRTLVARSGIGKAFSQQPENLRVGYGSINQSSSSVDGENTSVISDGVRLFSGSDRENFFTQLYTDEVPKKGTPLRNALYQAGKYYKRTDNKGPWGATPGTNNTSDHLECRQSFTILMTDGYYSGAPVDVGNIDGDNATAIGDYQYTPKEPFQDNRSNTLADVAMQFWVNDLRPDLTNDVPTPSAIDPAFWQHMVTFGIGLGVEGAVSPTDAFDAITSGDNIAWPNPQDSESAKIDDLLHASVNGRGGFFSAADPDTFATKLDSVLQTIVALTSASSTSAAASSAVLRQDSLSFSAGFRSDGWTGALQAAQIFSGGARGSVVWDAEFRLEDKGAAGRNLYTSASGSGIQLNTLSNLSPDQQDALNRGLDGSDDNLGQARINWLRGELGANPGFRSHLQDVADSADPRVRMLGDIIGSDPQFAGKTNYGHRRLPGDEGSSYTAYRTSAAYQSRPDAIYVGANDGFLHGFDALTGDELFGYMPSELLKPESAAAHAPVNHLMDPDYGHRYYVDGTPTVRDAYIDEEWKTILVGAMGAGGRTVFALDVSDPENFSSSDILWEFTNPDLGYGVESPQITRLPSGDWAAVFGNGYNGDSNESGLFVVNLADGSLISKIMTGAGGNSNPNGLATPAVMLDTTSGVAQTAYAGDLRGNLWRFDLTNYTENRLFIAKDSSGIRQPITAAPSLALNPDSSGQGDIVVSFGTGSYFRTADSGDNQVQTFYGIFDDGDNQNINRSDLLEQTITEQATAAYGEETPEIRVLSQESLQTGDQGWLIDLDTSAGERVISKSSYPSGFPVKRVRFSTLIPDNNDCGTGRSGYLMDVSLATGGRTDGQVFDLDRDGLYDSGDGAQGGNVSSSAEGSVVNGIRGIVNGEALRVVLDNTTDLFVESIIVSLVEEPTPPTDDGGDNGNNSGDGGDSGGDGGTAPPCKGPQCSKAPGYNFGRQSWEELR